jgi:hypothetical protein
MTKNKNQDIKLKNQSAEGKKYSIDATIVALLFFILFPYTLAVFIMIFTKSANSVLIDVDFFFSLVIAVVGLICSIICFKFHKDTNRPKITKIISIVNIVLTGIMCLIGLLELTYCFGIIFPYMMVMLDALIIIYIPIALILLADLIVILTTNHFVNNRSHKDSV